MQQGMPSLSQPSLPAPHQHLSNEVCGVRVLHEVNAIKGPGMLDPSSSVIRNGSMVGFYFLIPQFLINSIRVHTNHEY